MIRLTLKFVLASFLLLRYPCRSFMLTSNADAGSGTLKEALIKAAANGIADKDFIHFNLANQSESGRVITLLSQLSNVDQLDTGCRSMEQVRVKDSLLAYLLCYKIRPGVRMVTG